MVDGAANNHKGSRLHTERWGEGRKDAKGQPKVVENLIEVVVLLAALLINVALVEAKAGGRPHEP